MSKKKVNVNDDIQQRLEERVVELKEEIKQSVSKVDRKSRQAELKEEFELFWAKHKNKYKAYGNIADVVYAHFLTYGFNKPEKFEEGLKHFGLE